MMCGPFEAEIPSKPSLFINAALVRYVRQSEQSEACTVIFFTASEYVRVEGRAEDIAKRLGLQQPIGHGQTRFASAPSAFDEVELVDGILDARLGTAFSKGI